MCKTTLLAFIFFTSSTSVVQSKESYQIRALSGDEMIKQSAQMYLENNELNLKANRPLDTLPWSTIIMKKIVIKI